MLSRRKLLAGAGIFAGGAVAGRLMRPAAAFDAAPSGRAVRVALAAAERPQALPCFAGRSLPLWTFSARTPFPVIRVRQGERLVADVANRLDRPGEHLTVHWHGVRLPNAQDGVPYLTQPPIRPGESGTYDFAPPDAGTFFFHTHCNTAEQLGRGLSGVLIVDGDEPEPYDAERLLVLRDWSLLPGRGGDGAFGPFLTDAAARAGTFGTVRSCNGESAPPMSVPASADVRLRILNFDRTRIMQLGVEGADASVIAIDGNAVAPFALKSWFAGPGTRIDVAIRSPADGGAARLVDYFAPAPVTLATFAAAGPALRGTLFDPAPLRPSPIPEPDLARAERRSFAFSASATGAPVTTAALAAPVAPAAPVVPASGFDLDDLCSSSQIYWAINKQAWPGHGQARLPPPIATLELGRSYVFELRNLTPNMHPIHIHGHTFTVLKSSKRDLPVHHADTVLLQPRERMEVAFVADNPGDWMFHCHIIEHGETGMMSYLRVA